MHEEDAWKLATKNDILSDNILAIIVSNVGFSFLCAHEQDKTTLDFLRFLAELITSFLRYSKIEKS